MMNNTFEASFATIFKEPDTLDNASESTKKEYDDWANSVDAKDDWIIKEGSLRREYDE